MPLSSIAMLGGCGFVGSHLVAQLADYDIEIKLLTSRRSRHRDFLVYPKVALVDADIYDVGVLRREFAGVDAVVNLVGILNEGVPSGATFQRVHVDLIRTVVEACKSEGITHLLHMSALQADAAVGSSRYLRSKGEAENYLFGFAAKHMQVSCFCPSVIFGEGDSFFNRFAKLLRQMPVFPLACAQAKFAPVYVGDVVERFVDALFDSSQESQRIDLCGPNQYSLQALLEYTAATLQLNRIIVNIPDWLARLQGRVMARLPGKPFTLDNYYSLQTDSICDALCDLQPTAIESIVPNYLLQPEKQSRLQSFRQYARRS